MVLARLLQARNLSTGAGGDALARTNANPLFTAPVAVAKVPVKGTAPKIAPKMLPMFLSGVTSSFGSG
ncbi:unnamed protein product [Periconia digitata]|uniref:Uncharacterized protein n=1 Tax=Periconia digitata TaxID=1303443 RepID=A0A9W4ULL7_9PLEO|nr:unnamed protein product [Periconia digitata]